MNRELAKRLHKTIMAGIALLDDRQASEGVELYPRLTGSGVLVTAGTRINWDGCIKRAAVDVWDNEQSTPESAPALWEDISYRAGYRIIPEVITAGQAFALGECGWWGEKLYRSVIAANTYTPEAYPDGWEEAET